MRASTNQFAYSRYLKYSRNLNSIFPGWDTSSAGLINAVTYLASNPAASPITDPLRAGFASCPTTKHFDIKNLHTGVVLVACRPGRTG